MRDEDVVTELRRRWGSVSNFERALAAGDLDALAWRHNPRLLAAVQAEYEHVDPAPLVVERASATPALGSRDSCTPWYEKDWLKNYRTEPESDDEPTSEPAQIEKTGAERIFAEVDTFMNTNNSKEDQSHE
jgi:hypothetical protein